MKKILIIMLAVLSLAACDEDFERVFKQHLYSELVDAQAILDQAEEGTDEGQHIPGSKATLQAVIDQGYDIYWSAQSTQQTVDEYCSVVNEAVDNFSMAVNPSLANLRSLVQQAEDLAVTAAQNGIAQAVIDQLQEIVVSTKAKLDDPAYVWTAQEVAEQEQQLMTIMGDIENQLPGQISVRIENASFEPTGTTDEVVADFSKVPGWNNAGYVSGVTPWDGLLTNSVVSRNHWLLSGKAVEGDYALYVQTYSQQVWQTLAESVRDNCTYTITLQATRCSWMDAAATKLQVQLVVFDGDQGDFSNATILAEQEFANISSDDFQTIEMAYTPTDNIGRSLTIALRSYYNNPATSSAQLAWTDVGVSVDALTIVRERNE